MKESHGEGLANHTGSESCLDDLRGRGEALTGENTGELLNSENTEIREPSPWAGDEGDVARHEKQVASASRGLPSSEQTSPEHRPATPTSKKRTPAFGSD